MSPLSCPLGCRAGAAPARVRRPARPRRALGARGERRAIAACRSAAARCARPDGGRYTPAVDDERHGPGMPALDRQPERATIALPSQAGLPPRSVPETRPTPLQKHYVLISAPAVVLGAVAITALNAGVPVDSLLVKACVLVGAPLLAVANADALVRIWRSAWAWMPVDRGQGTLPAGLGRRRDDPLRAAPRGGLARADGVSATSAATTRRRSAPGPPAGCRMGMP